MPCALLGFFVPDPELESALGGGGGGALTSAPETGLLVKARRGQTWRRVRALRVNTSAEDTVLLDADAEVMDMLGRPNFEAEEARTGRIESLTVIVKGRNVRQVVD